MNVFPLIGSNLKSDDIIELLEQWEAEVIYHFDRLHENSPDSYSVTARSAGIELLFDAGQALTTVFLRVLPSDDCSPFDIDHSDVPSWPSIEDARRFAASQGLSAREGNAIFLGSNRNWIKLDYKTHSVHYEFIAGRLNMVTIESVRPDTSSVALDRSS